MSIVGGVVLLLIVLAIARIGRNPVVEDGNGVAVEIAALTVPVASPEPLISGPDQYLGVPSPEPEFDTSHFGPDLSFVQREDELTPLESDEVLRAVYLGHDTTGDAYYVWQSGSGDFWQLLGQIVADFGSFGRIETSYGAEIAGGDGDEPLGMHSASISSSPGSPATLTAEWHGLPSDVAAVVFYLGEAPVGWQRPVSGTAAIQYEFESGGDPTADVVFMVALDTDGGEWNRVVLFPG
ncbi:MAG TPA: hypothetical protein VIH55_03610 [Acidimicrobiia bacterium]